MKRVNTSPAHIHFLTRVIIYSYDTISYERFFYDVSVKSEDKKSLLKNQNQTLFYPRKKAKMEKPNDAGACISMPWFLHCENRFPEGAVYFTNIVSICLNSLFLSLLGRT